MSSAVQLTVPPVHTVIESNSFNLLTYTLLLFEETGHWTGVEQVLSSLMEKLYRKMTRMILLETNNDL